MNVRKLWGRLNEPRPSRGYILRWGCPGDGCDGLFKTSERARDHLAIAQVIGSHEPAPQRRARRERSRAAKQLRRQR